MTTFPSNADAGTIIRIRRSAHDTGARIQIADKDTLRLLLEHLDEFPVRSVIVEIARERTLVSLLCVGEATAEALPAFIVRDLAARGYLPEATMRALSEAKIIAAAGAPLPDELGS